ncbi:MAG: tRNA pseudouridine(38-40) synthase TruA [Candidatus Abyssobacteria bacterium SURF_5]|uniref:tRNA pseudouridine synthase A n=1 Tax=Abyssobacteria bacterium (strain SURF_5) TaxID=2093360 RepID=A0A3A4NY88_ABYX5|nr:MAG: tRNA pseudouridine(38-40) synthase TruA [Candidatus Abyssubacteria bacterium SURF_5]
MHTIRLDLQYDGSEYAGWQIQENAVTVQELVERALSMILRERIRVSGASRTDSGVHALGQVAAFTTESEIPMEKLRRSLNGILPPDIRLTDAREVEAGFAPRYAREKTYRYAFALGAYLSPFQRRYAWHIHEPLDLEAMQAAANYLVGEHDFSSFVAAGGGEKGHVRTIHGISFGEGGILNSCVGNEGLFHFDITANGFLYKMARNIIGTLVEAGRGKLPAQSMAAILEARDRGLAGPTAPAQGLCLVSVKY